MLSAAYHSGKRLRNSGTSFCFRAIVFSDPEQKPLVLLSGSSLRYSSQSEGGRERRVDFGEKGDKRGPDSSQKGQPGRGVQDYDSKHSKGVSFIRPPARQDTSPQYPWKRHTTVVRNMRGHHPGSMAHKPGVISGQSRAIPHLQPTNSKVQTGAKLPPFGERTLQQHLKHILGTRHKVRAAAAAEQQTQAGAANVRKKDMWEEDALSHTTGMSLLFLGTGTGHPSEQRRTGAVALKSYKSTWLFDCGEDSQRQVHKQPLIRHGKMDRVFITNRRASNILGLPGMMCTMSAARAVGMDSADVPLHLYGPPGLATFVMPMLKLSDTFISMPIVVHEFVDHAVPLESMETPELLDRRSALYRVLLPPDKLNPLGYYNGEISAMLERGGKKSRALSKGPDERIASRPLDLPGPGNPDAVINGIEDLRWSIMCESNQMVTAVRVPAATESWAYIAKEANRVGPLNVEAALKYGIHPRDFSVIKNKEISVPGSDGQMIKPSMVMGKDIEGRKLVFVGESNDSLALAKDAHDADVIVHAASCKGEGEKGMSNNLSTLDMAGRLAKAAEARHLILYKFQPAESDQQSDGSKGDSLQYPLNTMHNFSMGRLEAENGYIWRAGNHWAPVHSPPEVTQMAEESVSEILGRGNSVSMAADMEMYVVERRQADDTPIATLEEQQDLALTAA